LEAVFYPFLALSEFKTVMLPIIHNCSYVSSHEKNDISSIKNVVLNVDSRTVVSKRRRQTTLINVVSRSVV